MKTKTPFYELAEEISNETEYFPFGFHNIQIDNLKWFFNLMQDDSGLDYYKHPSHGINLQRSIMLLFADLLWQEEMKGGKK